MTKNRKVKANRKVKGTSAAGGELESEDVFSNPEPWSPVETKLVLWSFGAAVFFLAVFGFLVNIYILK